MAQTGYLWVEEGLKHDTGPSHPERADRLRAIKRAFDEAGIVPHLAAEKVERKDLLRVHYAAHIDTIEEVCARDGDYPDPDIFVVQASWDAALFAAGSAIAAARAVMDGEYTNVFVAARPPGHHAEQDRAMGFCLFNNVAVATRWVQANRGINKVAILDWDVHHGNGTQHTFYDDPSVYYISLHQFPHYPGTGRPEERGAANTNLNLIFPADTPAETWMRAFKEKAVPELERFQPDFLFISCGFDAHRLDPLGGQNLEAEHYAEMTRKIKHLANGHAVSLLEGGYNLDALAASALAHYRALEE